MAMRLTAKQIVSKSESKRERMDLKVGIPKEE